MSDTNGQNDQTRLDRLEASHVKLMTDYGLFVTAQEQAWARHEKFVAEQELAWKRQQEHWERQRERDKALDERIDKLVGGIGEFMRRGEGKA